MTKTQKQGMVDQREGLMHGLDMSKPMRSKILPNHQDHDQKSQVSAHLAHVVSKLCAIPKTGTHIGRHREHQSPPTDISWDGASAATESYHCSSKYLLRGLFLPSRLRLVLTVITKCWHGFQSTSINHETAISSHKLNEAGRRSIRLFTEYGSLRWYQPKNRSLIGISPLFGFCPPMCMPIERVTSEELANSEFCKCAQGNLTTYYISTPKAGVAPNQCPKSDLVLCYPHLRKTLSSSMPHLIIFQVFSAHRPCPIHLPQISFALISSNDTLGHLSGVTLPLKPYRLHIMGTLSRG
ncbi:uncharacterized protein BDR25DRAFT_358552 [Lindgomyces ingoldianus]|uniref:Uncharacterized protein n=1 Tax=Lindgomyces ingoldianus TaxID=673940 RepID=A0ACB6QM88_9PLEO|nr:uncharacterized protein BDR25DRAFT_358552 [Lindgomyces ingoldianus]KAF2467427.1 hypothetical protein BDR25DRAFT_358552 [Lindgomyces ingoldianus]